MKTILTSLMLLLVCVVFGQQKYQPGKTEGFQLLETPLAKVDRSNGKLIFETTGTYYYTLPFGLSETTYSTKLDFVIESNPSNSGVGFELVMEGGEVLKFLYYNKGKIFISQKKNSAKETTTLKNWEESSHIRQGLNEVNSLEIKVKDTKAEFLVNGKSVFETSVEGVGIGFIRISNTTSGAKYSVHSMEFSTKPTLRRIEVAQPDSSQKLTEFDTGINHPLYSQVTPLISADEKNIFYVRKEEHDRVFHARRRLNGTWEPAMYMEEIINVPNKNRSAISINTDGTILFIKGAEKNGSITSSGITKYEKEKSGNWSQGKASFIDNYINKNQYSTAFLSNDEQYLMFCLDNNKGHGDQDIHVSFLKPDGNYSEPLNLGSKINSAGTESYAFLAPDNATLYFSTEGLPGFGSNDVFMTKRLDNTWTNWTDPVNLGSVINSTAWDGYFSTSASGNVGLIASSHGREKSGIFYFELGKEVRPNPVMVVSGRITDQDTKEPLQATVVFTSMNGEISKTVKTNPETGKYSAVLLKGEKYEILAVEQGFYPVSELIDLTELASYQELEKNLQLARVKVGQVIRLNNIFFEFSKAELMVESYRELDRLITMLNDNPSMKIEISGHTDAVGSVESNLTLSQNRANSVVEYIKSKGINSSRLVPKGYGKSKPVADNETEEGRALNRRVEFKILQ